MIRRDASDGTLLHRMAVVEENPGFRPKVNEHSVALAKEWRKLSRAATFVALQPGGGSPPHSVMSFEPPSRPRRSYPGHSSTGTRG